MKKNKNPRKVKKPSAYETVFLQALYNEIKALVEKNKTTPTQMAGDCDIDFPNLCRYHRQAPNARMLSALRLVKPMGHSFGELVTIAERIADEWQKQEDEKKKNGK